MTNYLIDTNVFIEAKNRHYGFDFCPAFWDWLIDQNHTRNIASIDEVAKELHVVDDDLASWARRQNASFFLPKNEKVVQQAGLVSDWVCNSNNGYRDNAITTFLAAADYWLVAHALALECTVVTHEIRVSVNSKKHIKIPNVCDGFNLGCINPYEMLRVEGARFVLGSSEKLA